MNDPESKKLTLEELTDRLQRDELTVEEARLLAEMLKAPEAGERFVKAATLMAALGDELAVSDKKVAADQAKLLSSKTGDTLMNNTKPKRKFFSFWSIIGSVACLFFLAALILPVFSTARSAFKKENTAPILCREFRGDEGRLSKSVVTALPCIVGAQEDEGNIQDNQRNTEAYDRIVENAFMRTLDNPLSTFSLDVDTASYSNVRRFLTQEKRLPPPDAVRIEEFLNYFDYDYPQPTGNTPFSVSVEAAQCPWKPEHRLLHIGIKGKEIPRNELPPLNLVYLIDVSGSMNAENRLPLLKKALLLLTDQLTERDRVAMVVYASAAGLVLPGTSGAEKEKIRQGIKRLEAGGATDGAGGIQQAYEVAQKNFVKNGVNRVILCTDGDFNVGVTDQGQLIRMIEEKRQTGIYLTILGFGMGNYKDSTLVKLAGKGNGNYAFIDNLDEAKKVFVTDMAGTLVTIAKDVKVQIEFNPTLVAGYRLIGYEKRVMAAKDFNDDTKDAGEVGAGHTVTALYEIVPAGLPIPEATEDELRYLKPREKAEVAESSGELMTMKLRYKLPDEDVSRLVTGTVLDNDVELSQASENLRFASAVAAFGLILFDSKYKAQASYDLVLETARGALGHDAKGYRKEFLTLVETAKKLAARE